MRNAITVAGVTSKPKIEYTADADRNVVDHRGERGQRHLPLERNEM